MALCLFLCPSVCLFVHQNFVDLYFGENLVGRHLPIPKGEGNAAEVGNFSSDNNLLGSTSLTLVKVVPVGQPNILQNTLASASPNELLS